MPKGAAKVRRSQKRYVASLNADIRFDGLSRSMPLQSNVIPKSNMNKEKAELVREYQRNLNNLRATQVKQNQQ